MRFTKWGDGPHWEAMLEALGEDVYGVWLGGRAGVTFARPGVSFETVSWPSFLERSNVQMRPVPV